MKDKEGLIGSSYLDGTRNIQPVNVTPLVRLGIRFTRYRELSSNRFAIVRSDNSLFYRKHIDCIKIGKVERKIKKKYRSVNTYFENHQKKIKFLRDILVEFFEKELLETIYCTFCF